ncbi:hypothetical protein B4589_008250 [Halolamina sp. CBA1230]|uniref:hypothetical protein n=1 Tax=Halolamina sp. CBA1230 TaxID=1853690 RepID=UPI0009A1AED6|nr:hypothetical protein [Halolamina sp. CBA1230]QKY18822.1 hypothetical protein B4589_008250 [Halolamina sp. CBA1230]
MTLFVPQRRESLACRGREAAPAPRDRVGSVLIPALEVERPEVGEIVAEEQRLAIVAEQFEGDYYDENPDWDADLPDLDTDEDEQ